MKNVARALFSFSTLAAILMAAPTAWAQDGVDGANTAWILTATALVLFMTLPGLSLFYGGLVRVRNVLSVLMQCFAIACLMSLLWMAGAYGLAFGDEPARQQHVFLGIGGWRLDNRRPVFSGTEPGGRGHD